MESQWECANCYCTIALLYYCTIALLHYCTITLLHYCTGALLEVWSIGGGGSCDHWSRCPCCTVHPSLLIIRMLTKITKRMTMMRIIIMLTMVTMRMMNIVMISLLILHPFASYQSLPSESSSLSLLSIIFLYLRPLKTIDPLLNPPLPKTWERGSVECPLIWGGWWHYMCS